MVLLTTDEYLLKNKIDYLQAQMMDFNRQISPVKGAKTQEQQHHDCFQDTSKSWKSTLQAANLAVLKIVVCAIWPFVFPTTVYCVEGDTSLFYSLACVSIVLATILGFTAVHGVRSGIERSKMVLNIRIQKICNFLAKIAESFGKDNASSCVVDKLCVQKLALRFEKLVHWIPLGLASMFLLCMIIFVCTGKWDDSYSFYMVVLVVGYGCGLLTTFLIQSSRGKDMLPFSSPACGVKMQLTSSSPVHRKLDFSNFDLVGQPDLLYGLSPGYTHMTSSVNDRIFY